MAVTVRDPIHGSIRLSAWVLPIVDAPVMQRLRRVSQLGTAHLVYPGAHHRRFEHSLGAYHLAGRLGEALGLDAHDARTVRAAALLHDVGHGPFSHAFEELHWAEGQRHEDTSVDLLRWGPLGDLLRRADLDPVEVSDVVAGKGRLASLVSGPVDADRMDYLLRDAHYTGVPSSVDPDRLLAVLERDDAHGIVLREAGITSAESLLTMRFLMYPAVYLHHTVRASEAMLQAAIRAAVNDGLRMENMQRLTDDELLHMLRSGDAVAAELVARLDERRLYKRAYEGRPEQADDERVQRWQRDGDACRQTEAEIAGQADVPRHHVILDVPKPPRFHELDLQVRGRDGTIRPLVEASRLVHVMEEARLDHWRFWVFCPKADRAAVAKAARDVLGPPSAPSASV